MKLKNSITKKILTSLLIGVTLGTTLTGIAGNTAFADTNTKVDLSHAKIVSPYSSQGQKVVRELQNRTKVILQQVGNTGITLVYFGQVSAKLYAYVNGGGFLAGHVSFGNDHFHFGDNLSALTGWYNENDGCRYYYEPGKFASPKHCFKDINGEIFHFNNGGSVDKGTKTINGQTYDFNSRNGALNHPENYGRLLICV